MKKVFFKTFGCRTNIFDTQIMMSSLKEFAVTEKIEDSDYIVINSCTVTNSADTNSRQFLNRVKREYPNTEVLFTGCAIQTQGKSFFENKQIKSGFGHSEKERVEDFLKSEERIFQVGDLTHIDSTIIDNFVGKSRAFIKIQEGCNFKCNFCIIPTVRGSSRSYEEKNILEQISKLASNGFGEFILTGTNIGSYGDNKTSLAKLLKKISQIRGVRRIRLGSVEPSQITSEFREILSEDWMGKYIHIATQYSDNRMLKAMNRRNRVEKDIELLNFLASKGYAIGTDYIIGHPTENDEIFESAFENISNYPLTHIHLFRYSKRDGTPSATMKTVDTKAVKERFARVENLIKEKNAKFRDLHSENLQVLFERKNKNGLFEGYDQFFNTILLKSDIDITGDWKTIDKFDWRKFNE
jgi:MiaB-like tRNA modifying enzyme